ncbi:hypothetical protein PRIPAC_83139 [Pristionchus pacificus]|uniref:Uncharacterized protein n=1 Tax=Pristionchus pacificus TaxID=54126 RepID=A0A2A6BUM7_PRIPA|nr:hypothetical protein PRIPAC_83139 [Pristionchus pacificus]|eukprot:PDM69461.1 hypothetical protein PRIPAC_44557 [Pristionchus pacificus]
MVFNPNDPKYKSCCCGCHVTICARVLMVLSIVGFALQTLKALGTPGGVPLLSLIIPVIGLVVGSIGVFNEKRTPLLIYIILQIAGTVLSIIAVPIVLSSPEFDTREVRDMKVPVGIIIVAFIAVISFFVIKAFWNLYEYLKDRDEGDQLPVHYEHN